MEDIALDVYVLVYTP